jgi:hypothetical protein
MIEQIVLAVLKFLYSLTKENDTLSDAQTPPEVRKRWNAWVSSKLSDKLRNENGGVGPKN